MSTYEMMVAKALGRYEGQKEMLRKASEEMFQTLPVNEAGETDASAVEHLNNWVARMEAKLMKQFQSDILDADKFV